MEETRTGGKNNRGPGLNLWAQSNPIVVYRKKQCLFKIYQNTAENTIY